MASSLSRGTGLRRAAAFAAAGAATAGALWVIGLLEPVDRTLGDALLRLTHRGRVADSVTTIVIDDRSVAALGPLPWPRGRVAEVVTSAHRFAPAGVIVDLLLLEPGGELDDRALADALALGPSILAAALGPDGSWLLPDPSFGGADRAAHVHVEVATDGVARTVLATKQSGGLALPAMSLAAARLLRPDLVVEPGVPLRPDFRPAPSRMPTISAVDLVDHRHDADTIAGGLVFVGVTATGTGDRLVVPTDPGPAPAPGVLVHASATASLLSGGLVTPAAAPWILVAAFAAAAATQVARNRAGVFRPVHLVLVLAAVLVGCFAALQAAHLLLAPAPLLLAPVAAVLLREAAESRTAQQRSGRLLGSLLRHLGVAEPAALPTTAAGRLAALIELQDAVLRDDRARRALLDGLSDGVVMWNGAGEVVIANPAARRLWGSEPVRRDLELAAREREPSLRPGGAEVAVTTIGLDDGGLAILRDVTAELELERRRRDMQRLVSHELKTPLASIAGLGETIERYELDRDEQRRVASLIRDESTRLGSLVTTFLDLERLGAGGWQGEVELVDLADLVRRRLDILGQAARARGQQIDRRLESGVRVRVEPDLFARVVDNLLGNAVKYSLEGSTVTVGVRRDAGGAVLTVTDEGPGIPEDAVAHLFERFYRVPGSRGGGSGLGLALVQEVVDWHGGCIEVDSTIGRGTTFTVRLPEESEGHATQGPGR